MTPNTSLPHCGGQCTRPPWQLKRTNRNIEQLGFQRHCALQGDLGFRAAGNRDDRFHNLKHRKSSHRQIFCRDLQAVGQRRDRRSRSGKVGERWWEADTWQRIVHGRKLRGTCSEKDRQEAAFLPLDYCRSGGHGCCIRHVAVRVELAGAIGKSLDIHRRRFNDD